MKRLWYATRSSDWGPSMKPLKPAEVSLDDVDMPGDSATRFEVLARSLREYRPGTEYYAATLHRSRNEWILEFFSHRAGFPDDRSRDEGIQLRRAVPVEPEKYSQLWELQDQGWIVVNDPDGLLVFMAIGGNAFISDDIARRHFKQDVEPHPVVQSGGAGYWSYNANSREVRMRRPTRKQRQRILDRDGHQCQMCGWKWSDERDLDLQIHHIKPFSQGGLTLDDNLITLCRPCHLGLDPHFQPEFFWGPDGPAHKVQKQQTAATHAGGKEAHRDRVISLLRELAQRT